MTHTKMMRQRHHVIWLLLVTICYAAAGDTDLTVDDYLERCMLGVNHKITPGPESSLYGQCSSWASRSCCTDETAEAVHRSPGLYSFDWNHCSPSISEECKKWLIQDNCFYECSPNVGPWLVPHDISIRDERFLDVPLCRSECNSWFEACRNDYTCLDNWAVGWNWTTGTNSCPSDAQCRTFETTFGTADNMCAKLWGGSFQVVDDSQSCMVLFFEGENPNYEIAKEKAEDLAGSASQISSSIWIKGLILSFGIFLTNY